MSSIKNIEGLGEVVIIQVPFDKIKQSISSKRTQQLLFEKSKTESEYVEFEDL